MMIFSVRILVPLRESHPSSFISLWHTQPSIHFQKMIQIYVLMLLESLWMDILDTWNSYLFPVSKFRKNFIFPGVFSWCSNVQHTWESGTHWEFWHRNSIWLSFLCEVWNASTSIGCFNKLFKFRRLMRACSFRWMKVKTQGSNMGGTRWKMVFLGGYTLYERTNKCLERLVIESVWVNWRVL